MSSDLSVNSFTPMPMVGGSVPVSAKPVPDVSPQPVKAPPAPAPEPAPVSKTAADIENERMKKNIHDTLVQLNNMMMTGGRSLRFVMDEKLGRPIIYVENTVTGEIIRQIPDETVLRVAHGIDNFKGLLHKASA